MLFSDPQRSVFDPPTHLEIFFSSPVKYLLRLTYYISTYLRSTPSTSTAPLRLICLSDTHTHTAPIPDGDVLIHAGDLTDAGTPSELQAQIDWLDSLPHAHKLCIAGNHDTYLDPRSRATLSAAERASGPLDWKSVTYLQHSSAVLKFPSKHGIRELKVYGAPQLPACGGSEFAFQYPRGQDAWSETLPQDVDVLITHTPPKTHLDLPVGLGCEHLLREIWRVRPRVHVFGHVHAGRGTERVFWDEGQKAYETGCQRPDGLIRSSLDIRLWICLAKVLAYGAAGLLWDRVWGGQEDGSHLVNASLMYNNTGRLGNEPQIVKI